MLNEKLQAKGQGTRPPDPNYMNIVLSGNASNPQKAVRTLRERLVTVYTINKISTCAVKKEPIFSQLPSDSPGLRWRSEPIISNYLELSRIISNYLELSRIGKGCWYSRPCTYRSLFFLLRTWHLKKKNVMLGELTTRPVVSFARCFQV